MGMGSGELHQVSEAIGELRGKLEGLSGWMRRIEAEGTDAAKRIENLQRSVDEVHTLLKALPTTIKEMSGRLTDVEKTAREYKTEKAQRRTRMPLAVGGGAVGGGGLVAVIIEAWEIIKPFLFKGGVG